MADTAQKRALRNYRSRLAEQGLARFEVLGLDRDRELIRTLARCLAKGDQDAERLRVAVARSVGGEPPRRGSIVAALRRSPLVGAEVDMRRPQETGREIDL